MESRLAQSRFTAPGQLAGQVNLPPICIGQLDSYQTPDALVIDGAWMKRFTNRTLQNPNPSLWFFEAFVPAERLLFDDNRVLVADADVPGFQPGLLISGIGYIDARTHREMWHDFAEEGGRFPKLARRDDGRWAFIDGSYSIGPEGIRN